MSPKNLEQREQVVNIGAGGAGISFLCETLSGDVHIYFSPLTMGKLTMTNSSIRLF